MPDDQIARYYDAPNESWKDAAKIGLLGLGAISLFRMSRFLALALAGAWIYDHAIRAEGDRRTRALDVQTKRALSDQLDMEIDDSFPASDPPSSSGSIAGAPD